MCSSANHPESNTPVGRCVRVPLAVDVTVAVRVAVGDRLGRAVAEEVWVAVPVRVADGDVVSVRVGVGVGLLVAEERGCNAMPLFGSVGGGGSDSLLFWP